MLLPHALPRLINRVHQIHNVPRFKPTGEISGRRRVRNALRSQAVEKTLILTAQLDVFQAHSSRQEVIGHIENVIALVVGEMPLEHLPFLIQQIDHAHLLT